MDRSTTFWLSSLAAVVCLIIAILYWTGHMFYPSGVHVKHGILFLGLAIVAGIIAAVNRPMGATV
jgi:hypothetical protein